MCGPEFWQEDPAADVAEPGMATTYHDPILDLVDQK